MIWYRLIFIWICMNEKVFRNIHTGNKYIYNRYLKTWLFIWFTQNIKIWSICHTNHRIYTLKGCEKPNAELAIAKLAQDSNAKHTQKYIVPASIWNCVINNLNHLPISPGQYRCETIQLLRLWHSSHHPLPLGGRGNPVIDLAQCLMCMTFWTNILNSFLSFQLINVFVHTVGGLWHSCVDSRMWTDKYNLLWHVILCGKPQSPTRKDATTSWFTNTRNWPSFPLRLFPCQPSPFLFLVPSAVSPSLLPSASLSSLWFPSFPSCLSSFSSSAQSGKVQKHTTVGTHTFYIYLWLWLHHDGIIWAKYILETWNATQKMCAFASLLDADEADDLLVLLELPRFFFFLPPSPSFSVFRFLSFLVSLASSSESASTLSKICSRTLSSLSWMPSESQTRKSVKACGEKRKICNGFVDGQITAAYLDHIR